MRNRKWIMWLILICLLAVFAVFACSRKLEVHHYEIDAASISEPVKFAVITDLHSSAYGRNMETLIDAVNKQSPDAVFLVGDIFDNHYDNKNSWTFVSAMAQRYPCYYVTGNHEIANETLDNILWQLEGLGVHVMSGNSEFITIRNQKIRISGIDDVLHDECYQQLRHLISAEQEEDYHILLSHRPELTATYNESGADLVISGHAHGGQWRAPLLFPNGLYAPHQGVLPKYTGGLYEFKSWNLLVSRGLDKQSVPYPRIFNRPEVVILTLS